MREGLIDLHTHTTCSDGSVEPEELARLIAASGGAAFALTDHDTVAGLARARSAAEDAGIELINGLEISADYGPGTMHILGYCIDESSAGLAHKLEELRSARDDRNPRIALRLQAAGVDIAYEEVASLAGNDVVGRPHFARLLVERGYAASIQHAFDLYLAKGAAAYVEKERMLPADSIQAIHAAGGVAVLAHPYQLRLASKKEIERQIADLVELGLDGIEAIYSRHNPVDRDYYQDLAARLGLLVTGGSDFHGSYKPDISVVSGLGDLRVPYALLDAIKERASRYSQN